MEPLTNEFATIAIQVCGLGIFGFALLLAMAGVARQLMADHRRRRDDDWY